VRTVIFTIYFPANVRYNLIHQPRERPFEMAYQVKIGYGPGDWDIDTVYATKEAALQRQAELAGKIFIGRYKFALPIKIKQVNDRCLPQRPGAPVVTVAAPILRKRVA
jgi:hypothetical protein